MNFIHRQFFALYGPDMPGRLTLGGAEYVHTATFKCDFFAATGLYQHEHDQVVIKIYRRRRFFGLPMAWLGWLQAEHERRLYRLLEKIDGIPALIGQVDRTGLAHEFIPGRPLSRSMQVGDAFFDQMELLIDQVHARDVAYVDMDKAENILLGSDGRPYLVDFQISYAPRVTFFVTKLILHRLQREDWYHFRKHKRRIRPDLLTPGEKSDAYRRSPVIHLHRALTRPYFFIRRRIMTMLGLKSIE